jgi:hypothetical protein
MKTNDYSPRSPRLVEEETVIHIHDPSSHSDSMRLFQWWMELVETGDIERTFYPTAHPLGPFMALFNGASKTQLIYSTNSHDRIQLAVWGEPVAPGVLFFSLWANASIRHTKRGVQMVLDIYRQLFNIFHVLCGITKQERLLKTHVKLGYQIISKIPLLWGGVEDGWLMLLTKENFYTACGRE